MSGLSVQDPNSATSLGRPGNRVVEEAEMANKGIFTIRKETEKSQAVSMFPPLGNTLAQKARSFFSAPPFSPQDV